MKMKKALSLFLILVLALSLAAPSFAAETVRTSQDLTVDGKPVVCDIYNIDGYNYFKLRDLAYLLNGTGSQFAVGYDEATRTVSVSAGAPYFPNGTELVIGDDMASTSQPSTQPLLIDGQLRGDLHAYNIGGYNFFKLRDLGDALNFDVDYNEDTRTMVVTSRTAQAQAELNAEQIYAKCVPAVFLIEVFDAYGNLYATGSGFFIDSLGTAVTNFHVIYGGTTARVTVTAADGSTSSYDVAGVYDCNQEEDWAVLKVNGSNFSWLRFGDPATVVGGATVYALGSPLGLDASISQGLISNPARLVDGQVYIQTSAAISHGSSGGALLNKYGDVIGITSAAFEEGQNLNLAIPVSRLSHISRDSVTPISETYTMPTGTLELESYYVSMNINSSFVDNIRAMEFDCDEDTYISYEVDNADLISCEWGSWNGDDIPLYIYSKGSYGTTTVWIYYYTESDVILAGDYIIVDVCGGYLSPSDYADYDISIDVGVTYSVPVTAYGYDGQDVYVYAYPDDAGIVELSFGDWNGSELPLFVKGVGAGETYINLELYEYGTDKYLATDFLYVNVN